MAQKYFGLQWHITDSCDQRCKHCYIYAGKDLCKNNDLPFEKLSVILQDFIITSNETDTFYLCNWWRSFTL